MKKIPRGVLTIKVSAGLREYLAQFCDEHALQIGRFVEAAILNYLEELEDQKWAMNTFAERINEPVEDLEAFVKKLGVEKKS